MIEEVLLFLAIGTLKAFRAVPNKSWIWQAVDSSLMTYNTCATQPCVRDRSYKRTEKPMLPEHNQLLLVRDIVQPRQQPSSRTSYAACHHHRHHGPCACSSSTLGLRAYDHN